MMKAPKLFAKTPKAISETTRQPLDSWEVPRDGRPSLTLNSNQVPEIKEWKTGEKYTIEITIEQVSNELIQSPRGDTMTSRFIITHYELESKEEEKVEGPGAQ